MTGDNSLKCTFHNDFKEVSIRDLLSIKQMYSRNTTIAQQGFQRIIKSATTMDMEDIDDWLHEGDILIINCFMCTCFTEKFINTLYQK